jgi:hypothetical protein
VESFLCTLVSLSGIVVWISYNSIYFASPVEFIVAPYYSALSQAIEGENRETLFLRPMNAAHIYGTTAVTFLGPAMIAGAIVGYAVHRKFASKEEVSLLYLFLAVPSIKNFPK